MQDLEKKLLQLSPEQRELFLKKLKEKGLTNQNKYEKIEPREDKSFYPLSFAQERLWFLNQLNPDSPFYNIPAAIKINGELNVNAFAEAFENVISRHEILNVVFKSGNDGPVQYIHKDNKTKIEVIDFSNLGPETKSDRIKLQINNLSNLPFDLSKGPLFRASLIKLTNNEYIFIICFHHIIADGWSIGVFINDLLVLYKSRLNGSAHNLLEPLDIQYFDFSAWQKNKLIKGEFDSQLNYWKEELRQMPELLDLPFDNPRRSIQTFNGKNYEFKISKELKQKLIEISKSSNASMFMVLLAAFQLLLNRFSGQKDFGIGIPAANRNHPQIKKLIGFFVNSLIIRSEIETDSTFEQHLEIVKEKVLKANENQDIPFEKIVESLGIKKDISHTPLFQVMFDYQINPLSQIELPGINLEIIKPDVNSAKFDLLLLIEDLNDEFICSLEYNSDLFNNDSIVNLTSSFITLLESIVSKPLGKLKDQKIISDIDFEKIVKEINNTYKQLPLNMGVHNYFEEQVKEYPDKIALEFEGRTLTYNELNEKANQLARYLKSKGVKLESTVGIALDRSFEQIISVIATVKCGAVYVPIDTNYPAERILYMLKDSGLRFLIKTSNKHIDLNNEEIAFLDVDTLGNELSKYSTENLDIDISSNNVIYLMYTSGSTGVPKGVEILHSGVMRLVKQNNFGNMNNQNFLALSSFSFDASTLEIWGSLANGSKLVLYQSGQTSLNSIAKVIREKKISFIWLTTGLFNALVEENLDDLIQVNQILTGGEVLSVPHVNRVLTELKENQILVNCYGPTENTTFTTNLIMSANNQFKFSVPIGSPIKNTQVYILDEYFSLQPFGVIGELCIGGLGLARGYLNSPASTAEKFIPNPYSGIPGDRLYRSGDLAKFSEKGQVEFIGRIDNQIKLRGFRIELGEIESVIREFENIENCKVIFTKESAADAYLTAYIKFNLSDIEGIDRLKQYLAEKLPEHMIPNNFIEIDKFHLTPNGKIDLSKLPSTKQKLAENKLYVAPRNDLEKYLTNLWEKVLHVENVSIYDDFFELGGNSLKAAVLINRIQKDFNRETHVGVIFKAPRVAEFATYMFEYYPDVVKENFNLSSEFPAGSKTLLVEESKATRRISYEDIKKFKNIIKVNHSKLTPYYKKNPKAIFILSPPRSGSTLLRIMLAGNSNLFSPPELDLLSFDSLKQRNEFFRKKGFDIWLESILRAVMELKKYDVTKAESFINELEEKNISTMEFYGLMQEWLGERLLVDKTPSYAMDYDLLERAEKSFDEPLYIHLIRHPYAMIYSFIEAKLDEQFFKYNHNFSRRELAELIWLVSNQNIINFSKNIPKERIIQVKFEDLVLNPEKQLKSICRFIGIEFSHKMLDVYKGNKMTDAVKKNSQMVGDFKFYLHRNIDTSVVDRWENVHKRNFLSDESELLTQKLGYDIDKSEKQFSLDDSKILSQITKIDKKKDIPLSYSQQRLWFIDQLAPGMKTYNVPIAVRMKGKLDINILYESLDEIINRHEALRTIFPTNEGKVKQVILPSINLEKVIIDLRQTKNHRLRAEEVLNEEASKPFSLSKGPLIRVKLIRIEEDEYLFLISMHHIITDGWSVEILVREIGQIYSSKLKGKELVLNELLVQYSDYSIWQRKWMESDIFKKQLFYWTQKLKNSPSLLDLPTDKSRPHVQSGKGHRISFKIRKEKIESLEDICNSINTTPFVVLLTTFKILLSKYTNSNDIIVGTPVAGRIRKEIENLIGLFVNTLALRTNIKQYSKILDVINEVKTTVIEALSNQEVPFEKLIDELDIERSLSHSPLIQVMFVYNQSPLSSVTVENIEFHPEKINLSTSKFDINFVLTQLENKIVGVLEYNTDLFEEKTIKRMIEHFQYLLNIIIDNPTKKIADIELVTENEKQLLLNEWNNTSVKYDNKISIAEAFEKSAERYKNNIAVNVNNQTITYKELDEKSNQLAKILIEKGITVDSLVGFYFERSIESIISIIAIWKAGAAYIAIDPSYPDERINYMIEDSGIKIIITQKDYANKFNNGKIELIYIDEIKSLDKKSNFNIKIQSENLAYIIYTSGSTGKPKGVMIRQKAVLNLANELYDKIYSKGKELKVSLNAPLAFDASVQQLVALFFGHTLFIVPQETRLDGEGLLKFIRTNKLDVFDCVPTQLKILLEEGLADENRYKPSFVLPGGEPIDKKMWDDLIRLDEIQFFNMYGPTECTVDSTICEINDKVNKPSIGKQINNVTHYVLDEKLNLLPVGIKGELYIGGDGLARGYLNKPGLTSERFIPNPYANNQGERIYKTGDIVRYLPDGNIEYIGRIDNQVKLRGFRIELGEIEENIKNHPAVNEATVIIREDQPGIKKLVGYFTSNLGDSIDSSELRNYLSENLPDYMIPSVFVELDEMPKTPNGKIDRKNLPVPTEDDLVLSTEFVEAQGETEEILLKIWKEVLKVNKIGVLDNFFELGGDSILGIQVIAKANQNGIKLSPKNLFQNPTIKGLASLTGQSKPIIAEQGLVSGEANLTPIQKWFFEQRFKNHNHWNQSILLEVSEKIDTNYFGEAVKEIMKHHDVLRLRYIKSENGYRQIFSEMNSHVPFSVEDLSKIDHEKLSEIISKESEEYQQSLDIEKGPLFRIVYFKLNEEENDRLLIIIHHFAIDGVSWRIVLEDLQTAYEQLKAGREVKLPPKTTSFKYWSEKLISSANEDRWMNESGYWEELIKFSESSKIPTDFTVGENLERTSDMVVLKIPSDKTEILQTETIQKLNTNIVEVLIAAFEYSLSQWSGKRKHIIGMEGHGREDLFDDVDISRTLGWFTSIYPVLIDLKDSVSSIDSLKYIKEQLRKIPNNGIGFGILKYLSTDKKISETMQKINEPDIMFNYLGIFNREEDQKGKFKRANEGKGNERGLENRRAHLLDVSASIVDEELVLHINYSENYHKKETIEKLADLIKNNLVEIIDKTSNDDNIEISAVDFTEADITDDDLDDLLFELDE